MTLLTIVRARVLVDELCAAIDAGTVQPDERDILALAVVVQREAGPLAHDLLCKLASRCPNGQAALKKMAQ
jgi:hypothetical protein